MKWFAIFENKQSGNQESKVLFADNRDKARKQAMLMLLLYANDDWYIVRIDKSYR